MHMNWKQQQRTHKILYEIILASLRKSDKVDAKNVFGNFGKYKMVVASRRTESS